MRALISKQSPWMICPICAGDGHSSQHLGVVNPRDFDDGEWDRYLAGGYDAPCGDCGGTGKVREDDQTIVRFGPDGERYCYHDAADASEHFLRMAGG